MDLPEDVKELTRRYMAEKLTALYEQDPDAIMELLTRPVRVSKVALRSSGLPITEDGKTSLGTFDAGALLIHLFEGLPVWAMRHQMEAGAARRALHTRLPEGGRIVPRSPESARLMPVE